MRAKIITSLSTSAQPGSAARRLSLRVGRWASWAHALAGRFRAGRLRSVRAALVLQRSVGRQSAALSERIIERNLVGTALFAPRLHLTVSPVLRSVVQPAVLPGGTAGPEAQPGAAARAAARPGVARAPRARAGAPARILRVPLARAWARCIAPAAFSPGLSLTLARAGRDLPQASSSRELLALAGRVATRGQRREAPFRRPATALHHPSPLAPPPEASAEASARPRHRGPNGSPFPAGAPGMLMGTPGELDRLTEQVMHRIDRRMDAWRERTGRVR